MESPIRGRESKRDCLISVSVALFVVFCVFIGLLVVSMETE